MDSDGLIALIPLVLAALAPASLIVAPFFIARQRSPMLSGASGVVSFAAGCAYFAVITNPILTYLGYDAKLLMADSTMNDVVQLDIVSSAMFVLVSTLAVVVVRYSRSYLAGQRELDRYARSLLLTVASASVLVTSNNLAVLVLAWFATDVGLHSLLTFYRTRRQAIIVAHKKFLLSRVADACFVSSIVIIGTELGTLQIDIVNTLAQSRGALTPTLHVATVLLVVGVLLKSAQIPFHGWLQWVMEAPTPVSALLHAGVVNIGGFVMIRLAPLMANAYIAQSILIGVGLFTTVVAALVMATRVAVKGQLAWSTIGQMGFMLVQCGLGAWHLALMHLLAHSLYKAHMFLSSGSVVQQWRASHLIHSRHVNLFHLLAGIGFAGVAVAPFYLGTELFNAEVTGHTSSSIQPLTLVLALSFAPMLGRAVAGGLRPLLIAFGFALGASFAYFGWHIGFEVIAPGINAGVETSALKWNIVVIGLGVLFLVQTVMQTWPNGALSRWLQPHLMSGLYIDDWFTRVTFRLWPPGFQ